MDDTGPEIDQLDHSKLTLSVGHGAEAPEVPRSESKVKTEDAEG